jgi:hypothetical protein
MAIVPIYINAVSIADGYMVCQKHGDLMHGDLRLTFQPDRKATSPLDMTQWYMCPGLQADLDDPVKEAEYEKQAQAAADDPKWFPEITKAEERRAAARDYVLEDLDDADRASWFFVVEIEDATVTIG